MAKDPKTSRQDRKIPNPTGKGGFQDHPELRHTGVWDSKMTFSFQYRRFMNMPLDQLHEWGLKPTMDRTVVEELAWYRVKAAKDSLADVKEITDRTEGKAPQSIDITTDGDSIKPDTSPETIAKFEEFLKNDTKD